MSRPFDLALAVPGLVVTAPLWALAAVGIRLSSPGPIFFRAERVGKNGDRFTMFKFRTMESAGRPGKRITSPDDPRVFRFGSFLRRTKMDELPQLLNVLSGDMAIIGPRPEDPTIVEESYTALHRETLCVRPGLASPGSIFNYTHGSRFLSPEAGNDYAEKLLPVKLALDVVYVRKASALYDLRLVFRALLVIAQKLLGRTRFGDPTEMEEARRLMRQTVNDEA